MMNLEVGWGCDVGHKRRDRENQDTVGVYLSQPDDLHPPGFIVADGMGGYQGGKIASQIVVDTFYDKLLSWSKKSDPEKDLIKIVHSAHREVLKQGKGELLGSMGSTLVAALILEDTVALVNVGDARAYLINDQHILQISHDHSWVAEQERQGILTPEEARNHPQRNRVSMSISAKRPDIDPFYYQHTLAEEDILVLCSDGLWGMVPDTLIKSVVLQLAPQDAADKLVDLANANHGKDNISVIIVRGKSAVKSDLDDTLPGL